MIQYINYRRSRFLQMVREHALMFIFLFLAASISYLDGQTTLISDSYDLINFMRSDQNYINNKMDRYRRIEGSPYLNEDFVSGSVLHIQKKYPNLNLRYNHYEGYFEFSVEEGYKNFDPQTTRLDTVWMGDLTYVFVNYSFGKTIRQSFMELVNRGETKVYIRKRVTLRDAEPAKGYAEEKPARFEKLPDDIFIEVPGQPALLFKGKNSIKEIFPDHATALLITYTKKNKLKLRNSEGIIALCNYYDMLKK